MIIKIKVTKDILERSKMCSSPKNVHGDLMHVSKNCAIALAVREIFPMASVIATIHPFGYGNGNNISMPEVADKFIRDFDDASPDERVKMKPISFDIDVPEYVIERIGINEVETILSNSLTLEKV